MNIHVQILCGHMLLIFVGVYLGVGFLGHVVKSMFNF